MHSYFQKEHNMWLDISNKANISSMDDTEEQHVRELAAIA